MSNRSKIISTISPILNGEDFIASLIKSISAQTIQPYEQVFSDNCSDDTTWLKLQNIDNAENMILCRQAKRLDAHGSFRAAASQATSEYILIHPCDDRLHPLNIGSADNILRENPHIDVLCTRHISGDQIDYLSNPPWPRVMTGGFNQYNSDQIFDLAVESCFLPYPFTGLILRRTLFLEYLHIIEECSLEGAGDIALTLWLINKRANFAIRHGKLVFAFSHPKQESKRLSRLWLSDYIKLVDFTLDLEGLSEDHKIAATTYFMKCMPMHLFSALRDSSQALDLIAELFASNYWRLVSRCSRIDNSFGLNLKSTWLHNEVGRQLLLSMGKRRLNLFGLLIRSLRP